MKKRIVVTLVSLLFIYLIYGLFLNQFTLRIIPAKLHLENPNGFYDYRGVINVHTQKSTGSGDHFEVIQAAQAADLDFLFFTDTNNFDHDNEFEGYHGKVLTFVDGEYSYIDSRLLNLLVKKEDHLQGLGRSQALFADLLSQKNRDPESGIFVLAHPYKPGFHWHGEWPAGLDGIEIINLKSIWQKAWLHNKLSFFWTLLVYPFNAELSFIRLFTYPEQEIELWDKLSRKSPTIAIAGSDAEARLNFPGKADVNAPSYQTLFNIVSNHVLTRSELTGEPLKDKNKIGRALREGQFYLSFDMLANPKGFLAYLEDPQKPDNVHLIGSQVHWQKDMNLNIKLPQKPLVPFEAVVYKEGKRMMSSNSMKTTYRLSGPGTYRVVVRVIPTFPLPDGKKWIPWIFTNNFYVRP